jgi:uncharacterized phage-associated protein
MATAEAIARYFLQLAAHMEEPTPVTHTQLHKLLYYAQGWCLATRERPLFPANFQAWGHGPVEIDIYPKFADYEGQPIARHEAREDPSLTAEERAIAESIWLSYGKYAAWQLREMTHSEPPWKDARGTVPTGMASRAQITDEALSRYFGGLHAENCRKTGIDPKDLAQGFRDVREGRVTPWEAVKAELQSDIEAQTRTSGPEGQASRRAG